MLSKTEALFCAVALATLLTVQAKILRPSNAMERKEMCDKNLSESCPGAANVLPFAYPPEATKVDETCSAASTHFPCFKNYASACNPDLDDVESRYFLTYLDICDTSSHLYEGVRKSVKCMKIAEKKYNETCIKPMDKLEAELKAFASKISDHGISADDWDKLEIGLTARQELICFQQKMAECAGDEHGVEVNTVEELWLRFGTGERIDFLVKNQATVDTVLDNLNLEDEQKKVLRGKKD